MRISNMAVALAMVSALAGCMFVGSDEPDPATAAKAKAEAAPAPVNTAIVEVPNTPATAAPVVAAAPAPKTMSDAEILGFFKTANNTELAMASAAKKANAKGDVKTFASTLMTSHTDANKKEQDLEKKSAIKGDESAADAASFKSDADGLSAKLADAKGKEFEKAFVDGQVSLHQSMLDAIDNKLAPAAQNEDVKGYITSMRAAVADHLTKAQDLQKKQLAAATAPASSSKKAKK